MQLVPQAATAMVIVSLQSTCYNSIDTLGSWSLGDKRQLCKGVAVFNAKCQPMVWLVSMYKGKVG